MGRALDSTERWTSMEQEIWVTNIMWQPLFKPKHVFLKVQEAKAQNLTQAKQN